MNEPSLVCDQFRPKISRTLVQLPYTAAALHFLRAPDPYSAATITRLLTRHDHHTVTFADALASARELTRIPLPLSRSEWRVNQRSATVIAARAWSHLHLLMNWGEQTPIGIAAEQAGLYVPAHSWPPHSSEMPGVSDNNGAGTR
jgi:hypothetical protein